MPSTVPDPPYAPNSFSRALTDAIARRGLTLDRITRRLADADLRVSNATISYWSTGRSLPTRARSLAVVRELERILGVHEGSLVDAIPGAAPLHRRRRVHRQRCARVR